MQRHCTTSACDRGEEEGAHPTLQGWDGDPARGTQEMTARLPLMQPLWCEANAEKGRSKINYFLQRCYLRRNSASLQTVSDGNNFPHLFAAGGRGFTLTWISLWRGISELD